MSRSFQLYYITDSSQLKSSTLEARISNAIAAGIDWVQIREKHLPGRSLYALANAVVEHAHRLERTRVLVNDRLDVALASHSDGVHLGTRSLPLEWVRNSVRKDFVVGASCHSLQEAQAAEAAGANYVLLGPIFTTPSKLQYGPPLGLAKLHEVTTQLSIPVFALGGITVDRVAACRENGTAGIAGIRIFQDAGSVEELIGALRKIDGN